MSRSMTMRKGSQIMPLSVAVLVGGKSERFGSPKAFQLYQGKSLAAHLLEAARALSTEVFAVGRDRAQAPSDIVGRFPLVMDIWEEEGPLAGLHSALISSTQEVLFLCAVDMPFFKREVVEGLFRIWKEEGCPDVVVPRIGGRWEPLCALWSKKVLRVLVPGKWRSLQQLLSGESFRVREITEEELSFLDPGLECLRNFNTAEDWREMQGDARSPAGSS